jgi:hypothetical protein
MRQGHDRNHDDRPPISRTPVFDKALSKLGAQDRARVVAGLEEFERDWNGGRPIDEIRKQWDYKAPKVKPACTEVGLRQIRPTNATRAWLALRRESGDLLLVFVIRKTSPAEQQRIIDWLCQNLSSSGD